jgi:hypothetical protein|tara:strand:- start:643 stop:828 length:186 start_codon:yes stop_codon:yes gene_type:complete
MRKKTKTTEIMTNAMRREASRMGLLRGIFWTAAAVATGGLALALLPNDWDGVDFNDGGGDE